MHKDELINLHQMLSDVKDYFEAINPDLKFTQYNALKITPSQQHKSKMGQRVTNNLRRLAPRLPMP